MRNDILIYFTDGYGEKNLSVKPKHYKTLWVTTSKSKGKPYISLNEPYGVVRPLKSEDGD